MDTLSAAATAAAGRAPMEGRVVREAVRVALGSIAARFSDDAPSIDERVLRSKYRAMDVWPADAQLGLCILAWVLGPGFSLGELRSSVNRLVPDFAGAARAIGPGGTPSLITLGGIARRGFCNGAMVVRWNLDSSKLYWPTDLTECRK